MDLVGDILKSIGIRWQLFLAQLLGFLFVLAVLKTLLFGRIQKVLDDRAKEEAERKHAIAAAKKESDAAKARLDARMAEIEKQAYEKTQAEVRAGLKRKADLASAALDRAREQVNAAREQIGGAHTSALGRLESDVAGLALYIAGNVTNRRLEGNLDLRAKALRVATAVVSEQKRALEANAPGGRPS